MDVIAQPEKTVHANAKYSLTQEPKGFLKSVEQSESESVTIHFPHRVVFIKSPALRLLILYRPDCTLEAT